MHRFILQFFKKVRVFSSVCLTFANGVSAAATRPQPEDTAVLPVFSNWTRISIHEYADGRQQIVQEGSVTWLPPINHTSHFATLPQLLSRREVAAILKLVNKRQHMFNSEPDTVDSMPSHEIFVHHGNKGLDDNGQSYGETPEMWHDRKPLRAALLKIMKPIEERMTALVRSRYPAQCGNEVEPSRRCTPCFSLIRRYLNDERRGHAMHRDGQALVTIVTSLSDYEREYRGGLYVSSGAERLALALSRGDAVIHQSDLLHGVQVEEPAWHTLSATAKSSILSGGKSRRWSWILWYKDSTACEQHGHEWSESCATSGDPLCEYMYGWRMFLNTTMSEDQRASARYMWLERAAQHGLAEAMFKVGRSQLGNQNYTAAISWFGNATLRGDADAHYQLGHMLLQGLINPATIEAILPSLSSYVDEISQNSHYRRLNGACHPSVCALALFEQATRSGSSIFGGSNKAMYNLGIVALYGYAGQKRDPSLAGRWFAASRIPEGLMAYTLFLNATGDSEGASYFDLRARKMGFGSPERLATRDQPLFALHNRWPESINAAVSPPTW